MTSIIRVGQFKLVMMQIDEDSNERIMNCIQTPQRVGGAAGSEGDLFE